MLNFSKIVVIISAMVLFTSSFSATQFAFATDPPPTIEFVKVDDKGCKIFEIIDKNLIRGLKKDGRVIELEVLVFDKDGTETFSVKETSAQTKFGPFEYLWTNPPDIIPTSKLTLKACPGGDKFHFRITAMDQALTKDDAEDFSEIDVSELKVKAAAKGTFNQEFNQRKGLFADCDKIKKEVEKNIRTSNIEKVVVKCEITDKKTGEVKITVTGSLKDDTKPGLVTTLYDPHQVFFLIQLDICVSDPNTGSLICPTNVPINLIVSFESHGVVGGEHLPIDSTVLLLAGAQSTTWLIPVVLSIVGIGLVFLRRK